MLNIKFNHKSQNIKSENKNLYSIEQNKTKPLRARKRQNQNQKKNRKLFNDRKKEWDRNKKHTKDVDIKRNRYSQNAVKSNSSKSQKQRSHFAIIISWFKKIREERNKSQKKS